MLANKEHVGSGVKKRNCPGSRGASVLPSGADIVGLPGHVRLVPTTDILLPRGVAIGSLCEERMRGSRRCPLFHVSDSRLQIKIGKADTEPAHRETLDCR
jgi:hypothetical protein